MIRVINRYSWNKDKGDYAAEELYHTIAPELGIEFERIETEGAGKHPDAWVVKNGKRISLAEIKMVEYSRPAVGGFHEVKSHKTILQQIHKAKQQLRAISTDLPRVVYLICDAHFTDDEHVKWAIFGPKIVVTSMDGDVKYWGYRGLCREKRKRQDDKFKDGFLSAIICVREHDQGRTYSVFRNMISVPLPDMLIPPGANIHYYYGETKPIEIEINKHV